MKELEYDLFEKEVIQLLSKKTQMAVATCNKNRVTVRTVYVICQGTKVFFITKKAYTKYKQIIKNPNVALCVDNIQIEGVAQIKGHPNDDQNKEIIDFCLKHGYEDFKRYMRYKNIVLIQVEPSLITLWRNNGREYLDIDKVKAYRVGKG
ncbi:pyridoxamine 5'-phosphate oxidase family protein [Wukongibacter baidiensis]|uniref:pyridoxamine 5'-phosphate oxidase family protein n=1 Tax=Wukongibacter baidiensis TaxID=1723361 RepID=UPI003D7FB9E2